MGRMLRRSAWGFLLASVGYCDFGSWVCKSRSRVRSSAFMPRLSNATRRRIEEGAFAGVPVQEGFAAEHRREVLRHPGRKSIGPSS